jgi:hypothetical protein
MCFFWQVPGNLKCAKSWEVLAAALSKQSRCDVGIENMVNEYFTICKGAKIQLEETLQDHFGRQLVAPPFFTRARGERRGLALNRPLIANSQEAFERAGRVVGLEFAE